MLGLARVLVLLKHITMFSLSNRYNQNIQPNSILFYSFIHSSFSFHLNLIILSKNLQQQQKIKNIFNYKIIITKSSFYVIILDFILYLVLGNHSTKTTMIFVNLFN
jgi:hypothetical protein